MGVQGYTARYGRWFPPHSEYWTLDINLESALFRPSDRPVVADVLEAARHFDPASLEGVLIHGIFGFEIDRPDDQERTIEAIRSLLRPGSRPMVGWDRAVDGRPLSTGGPGDDGPRPGDPIEPESIRSPFRREGPPGLPARAEFADCSHVFDRFRLR